MVECTGLENRRTSKAYRGFESHLLRQIDLTDKALRQGSQDEGLFLFVLHVPHDDLMTIFCLQKRGTCSRFELVSISANFQSID